jgi:hypothetical protein
MIMRAAKTFLTLAIVATAPACAHRQSPELAAISHDRDFIDLQAGWRIRVVTPILKSGTFKVRTQALRSSDGTVNLKVSNDFAGYETDFYMTERRNQAGIAIRFSSAEVRDTNGTRTTKPQPIVPLFVFPQGIQYVRLLFLTRVSQPEHNEAMIGASSLLAGLEQLTQKLTANPDENCRNSIGEVCSWMPEGISVQPEKKTNKSKDWVPAL